MKSLRRLFFISLIGTYLIIICTNCGHGRNEPAGSQNKGVYFSVTGLPCEECANALQRALLAKSGIISAEVTVGEEKNNVKITYDQNVTSLSAIRDVITGTGRQIVGYTEF